MPEEIIANARRTHPHTVQGSQRRESPNFSDPKTLAGALPLPIPGRLVDELDNVDSLLLIRMFTIRTLEDFGLPSDRAAEIVLVVNEIATNAFVHGKPPASIRVWGGDDIVLFEVTDNGSSSADPFGGFPPPVPHQTGCRGLWLSRQPADRLEITTVALGTIARIGVVRVA